MWAGAEEQSSEARTDGGQQQKAPRALLPEATDRIYMAAWQKSLARRAEQMQELAQHNGAACAAHVPAHALDAQHVKVLYVPSELTGYS